ncbi:hypothetical protein S83_068844 [Arachis hypogaea]
MASRNQNRLPRSPSDKKVGSEELFSNKRRRIGADKMERQGATGSRIRTRSSSVNTRTDAASDARSAEPFECVTIEYTKGDVEGLGCRGVVPLLHLLIQKRFYLLLCEFNGATHPVLFTNTVLYSRKDSH